MLSESMLQKFTSRIAQLMPTQNNEECSKNESQANSENQRQPLSPTGKKRPVDSESKSSSEDEPSFKKTSNIIDLDESESASKAERIDPKQLSRLIALQKQKVAAIKQDPVAATTIKKTTPQVTRNVPVSAQAQAQDSKTVKPPLTMPKVATMNNLVKISTKISRNQMLKEIKFQAALLSMAPIRLLLYFCIEKMLFTIYLTNGYEKMNQRSDDKPFLQNQVKIAMVEMIGYLNNAERTLISRILHGVFVRLGMSDYFTESWLTEAIAANRKTIQNKGVKVEFIKDPPLNHNITSNIFIGVLSPDKKGVYNFPSLELEDEEYSQERIQDPEVYHPEQDLFFFKKPLSKQKAIKIQTHKRKKETTSRQPNYKEKDFEIRVRKLEVPQTASVLTFEGEDSQEVQVRKLTGKGIKEEIESEITSKKRPRSSEVNKLLAQKSKPEPQWTKQKIIEVVEEYIFGNIPRIANKIAERWDINPEEVKKLINESVISRSLPSKIPVNKKDSDIIKEIEKKSLKLEKEGVSHKELVKEILKFLQSKDLSNERKEQIMEQWIALKKQKKGSN